MPKGVSRAEATRRIVKLFVRKDAEAARADAARLPAAEGYSLWLAEEVRAGRMHCVSSIVDGQDAGSIWFCVESIHDQGGDYLNMHVAAAVLHDREPASDETMEKLVAAAKTLGCRTMTCKTVRPGLIQLLHRHGWEMLSVEMGTKLND